MDNRALTIKEFCDRYGICRDINKYAPANCARSSWGAGRFCLHPMSMLGRRASPSFVPAAASRRAHEPCPAQMLWAPFSRRSTTARRLTQFRTGYVSRTQDLVSSGGLTSARTTGRDLRRRTAAISASRSADSPIRTNYGAAFAQAATRGLVVEPLGQVTVRSLTKVGTPLRGPQYATISTSSSSHSKPSPRDEPAES